MTADVSVCIPNYNGAEVLRECLDSVRDQAAPCAVEILVYDDASTDESAAMVAAQYPSVRLLRGEENIGFSRACNTLAENASGQFLLFLNNDAFLDAGALAALWVAAQEEAESLLTLRQLDAVSGELLDLGMGLDMFTVPFPLREAPSPHLATLIGACLWVPADLFAAAGGFPPWFGSVAEDLYLCQYARLRGYQLRVLSDHSYRHHSGWTFGGGKADRPGEHTSYRRRLLSERNRACVFLMFFPWHYLIPLLPLWLLSWLLECLLLCIAERSLRPATRIYGPAFGGVVEALHEVRRKRAQVMAERRVSFQEFLAPYRWQPTKLRFLLENGLPRLR